MASNYLFGTRSRKRVAVRHLGRPFLEFVPFVCVVYLFAMSVAYIARGCVTIPEDERGVVYKSFGALISLCWALYAYATSFEMGFCKLHRAMIVYVYLVSVLQYADRWIGLGTASMPSIYVVAVSGFAILCTASYKLIIKRIWKK